MTISSEDNLILYLHFVLLIYYCEDIFFILVKYNKQIIHN